MSRRRCSSVVVGLLAVIAPLLGIAMALELHFVDVGQGDAVVIVAPDRRAVVYDGGPDAETLLRYLRGLELDEVVVVVASHAHADNLAGLPAVLEEYRPRFVLDNGVEHTTTTYERYLAAVEASGAQFLEPTARTLTLGEVRLHVLPSPMVPSWGHNDNSVGLVIEYGAFRASLTGDAEARLFAWWLEVVPELFEPVHVHKASHHGSDAGDTEAALARLRPEVVAVSAGRDNPYGHPHAVALRRYADVGAIVYRTDHHGTVVVRAATDGSYRIETTVAAAPTMPDEIKTVDGDAAGEPRSADHDGSAVGTTDAACVDLNTASRERLQEIVHIGPERAEEIERLRPFRRVEDLQRVTGIGPARLRDVIAEGVACVW
jgi:competence protein ComEC